MLFDEKKSRHAPFTAIDKPRRGWLEQEAGLIADKAILKILRFLPPAVILIFAASLVLSVLTGLIQDGPPLFPFVALTAALLVLAILGKAVFLDKILYWQKGILNIFLLVLLSALLISAINAGWRQFAGLSQSSLTPGLPAYFIGALLLLLAGNFRRLVWEIFGRIFSARLVKIYFWASNISALAVIAVFIFTREIPSALPVFLPIFVFVFFLDVLLFLAKTELFGKKTLAAAMLLHFILLLSGRNNFVWLVLAILFFAVLLWQALSFGRKKLAYPAAALALAALLFLTNFFWPGSPLNPAPEATGLPAVGMASVRGSAPRASRSGLFASQDATGLPVELHDKKDLYSVRENWQVLQANFRQAGAWEKLFGLGPAKSQSAWQASFIKTQAEDDLDGKARLASVFWFFPLALGIIGSAAWLLLIGYLFYQSLLFVSGRSFWPSCLFLFYLLFLLAFLFLPWTLPFYWLFVFFLALVVVFPARPASERQVKIGQSRGAKWGSRAGFAFLIILFFIGLGLSSRLIFAAFWQEAGRRAGFQASGLANLGRAARLNPWNESYAAALAEAQLAGAADYANIVEQKNVLAQISQTAASLSAKSASGPILWRSARLYKDLEAYALGSAGLGREAYGRAIAALPKNLALRLEAARFYRENFSALAGSLAPDLLFSEAQTILEQGLALAPDWLPLRPELAFLVEQREGIAPALAILEPWEQASVEIKFQIGRLHYNDGNLAAAEEKFLEIARAEPSYSNAHYSLALVYFRQNRRSESLAEFETVLRLNPGNKDVEEKIKAIREEIAKTQESPDAPAQE